MKEINKNLILGTALWGWGLNKKEAFAILDMYVELGGRYVDCATNYPINKKIEDYGLALKWLKEWIQINKIKLFIIVKIGSIDNNASSLYDLSKNRVLSLYEEIKINFNDSLGCISVHWDNRNENENIDQVRETIFAFRKIKEEGFSIGLSGIKKPEFYATEAIDLVDDWIIQCKENFLTQEVRLNYQKFFPNAKYYAYGINMGGFKISKDQKSVSAEIRNIDYPEKLKTIMADGLKNSILYSIGLKESNDLNMAFIFFNPIYSGIIIGPRTIEQMYSTYKCWNTLLNLNSNELVKTKILIEELHKKVRGLDY